MAKETGVVALMFTAGFLIGCLSGILLMAVLVTGKSEEELIGRIECEHARRRVGGARWGA